MNQLRYILLTALSMLCLHSKAQNLDELIAIDSLKQVVESAKNDSIKIAAIVEWDDIIYRYDPRKDVQLNQQIIDICSHHLNNSEDLTQGNYYAERLAAAYNALGTIYEKTYNDYLKSIDYYHRALELNKKINYRVGEANVYNNLGNVYQILSDDEKSLNYYTSSLDIRKELEDTSGLAVVLNNIGRVHQLNNDFDEAIESYEQARYFAERSPNPDDKGLVYYNLGDLFLNLDMLDSAAKYLRVGLEINTQQGYTQRVSLVYCSYSQLAWSRALKVKLSDPALFKKHMTDAVDYADTALQISTEVNAKTEMEVSYDRLYISHKALGNYDLALKYYEEKMILDEEEAVEETAQKVLLMNYKTVAEQQAVSDSLELINEKKVGEERSAKERTQRYALVGGLVLMVLFGLFIFNRFRQSQKQKRIIEQQKELVEEKNTEILDSINYAKRIQSAILPSSDFIRENLRDHFIYYRPKDVVAGDFYWVQESGGTVFFAAADCTGHGVPGALVSVICNNALNRSVKEYGIMEPAQILDKARDLIIAELAKSGEEVQDGMDISLCSLQGNKLKFAGANNPLWLVRENELIEHKGDKQPVALYDQPFPFTNNEIDLRVGDVVYIFTDGFPDQFGGPKGKKYKYKTFKDFLVSISDIPMETQPQALETELVNWMGDREQIDDICVIGLRV